MSQGGAIKVPSSCFFFSEHQTTVLELRMFMKTS